MIITALITTGLNWSCLMAGGERVDFVVDDQPGDNASNRQEWER